MKKSLKTPGYVYLASCRASTQPRSRFPEQRQFIATLNFTLLCEKHTTEKYIFSSIIFLFVSELAGVSLYFKPYAELTR